MMFVSLTVILGLFVAFVFVVLFIRLLGFITSPNIKDIRNQVINQEFEHDYSFSSKYDNNTGLMTADFIFPEDDVFLTDIKFDWNNFKKCAGRGIQTRVQHDQIGKFTQLDFHLLFHINQVDAWMGLIKDRIVYSESYLNPTNIKFSCEHRISGEKFSKDRT
mmetsp:Transcript_7417/g.8388  ORF Transcript_7417/g.8388 Transcript_7417/m.8388 type:complete len:162 (+) Transcript_7417:240-725(+)